MRRRQFIALLAVLALSFCILKFGGRLAVEDVREGEMAGSYPAEWYEMVSRETNEKGIQVVVDGKEKKLKTSVRMAEAGGFHHLIPCHTGYIANTEGHPKATCFQSLFDQP